MVIPEVTLEELKGAPQAVHDVLGTVGTEEIEIMAMTEEIEEVAGRYIERGAIGEALRADAQYVAASTFGGVDVLASWNFRHLVNLSRIRQYTEVNRQMGYPGVDIRSPMELEHGP